MSVKTTALKIIIPFVLILAGITIMLTFIAKRPVPKREVKGTPGSLVEVITVKKEDTSIVVKGTGTVKAAQEVSVIPEVSGRITHISPSMVVGGFLKKDETLCEIEDTDYRLALEQAVASRAKAEYELATIESQARIARTEWERLYKNSDTPPNPLALYEPQLKNAMAALASANAAVKQAEVDLERTKIRAPFNSRVRSEDIDSGQYVRTGNSIAVLSGTDTAEIIFPLPLKELQWLDIPGPEDSDRGSPAFVYITIGEKQFQWKGFVTRSTGEVDPKNRMTEVVVEIQDPYGIKDKSEPDRPALATGTFVQILIHGKILENVSVIPRRALREDETVWIMDRESKLRIQKIVPVRIEQEEVIVAERLEEGDRIILTNISGAADGMKLRLMKN
ncbi:MAG: efflux RND transporter periplasmic adaptor subunit [Nitrospiraceae bacterium]|nr:MAG: efflux RND transporter periplasmic adaptor subunit [Nitrospiraceae bacterium]